MNEDIQRPIPEPTGLIVTGGVGEGKKAFKLAILIASLGMVAFIVITLTFSFREPVFTALFPKPTSQAAALPSALPTPNAPIASVVPTAGVKRVFLTSQIFDGNLGGLAGADQKCQDLAINLGGSWKAWLSDSKSSAEARLTRSNDPYKLIDGRVVAENWDDLVDGVIKAQIDLTEDGQTAAWNVWTNTSTIGAVVSENNCQDFSSNDAAQTARVGSSSFLDQRWSSYGTSSCNFSRRLYCIEQ